LYERPATAFVAGFIGSPAMNLIPGRLEAGGVDLGGAVLPLDPPAGEPGRSVLAGLRPEHLEPAGDGPLSLRVELLERLGADTILHGRLADTDTSVVVRAAGSVALPLGENLRFAIRPEHVHLFDLDTGWRL
jgi:ABC-type sugar transport system ATPase subunit